MLDWNAVGAIGEILGAAAVVATLFYLASQIRQSTRITRAEISKDLLLTSRSAILEMATNRDLATIWARLQEQDVDDMQQDMFYQSFFRLYEVVHSLHGQGFVDSEIYESYLAMIKTFSSTAPFDDYWGRHKQQFNAGFASYVEEQRDIARSEQHWRPARPSRVGNQAPE